MDPCREGRASAAEDRPWFYIQQPYGFKQPRLLKKDVDFTMSHSNLRRNEAIVSCKNSEGYQYDENALWKIYRVVE